MKGAQDKVVELAILWGRALPSALLTFGTRRFCVGGCPGHWGPLRSILGLCLLDAIALPQV